MTDKEQRKAPVLRFKGFTDDWEQRKLGEISTKVNSRNKNNTSFPVLTNSATQGIVRRNNYFDRKIAQSTENYYIVSPNDFVYNPRISNEAPYGPIRRNLLNIKGLMSPLYYVFRFGAHINLDFCEFYFKTAKWHHFMYKMGDSGARSDRFAIKNAVFSKLPIIIPTETEQRYIGRLNKLLDELIDLQQRKLDIFTHIYYGLAEKLFENQGNWREIKLSHLVTILDKKRIPVKRQDRLPGNTPYYGANGIQDHVNGFTHEGEFILIAEDGANSLTNYPIFHVKGKIWVNNHAHVLKTNRNVNPLFLTIALKQINFSKYVVGGSRTKLNLKDLENISLKLPRQREQDKIGKIYKELQNMQVIENNKISSLKYVKQFLLQNMFI